jgi:hypothetical protein
MDVIPIKPERKAQLEEYAQRRGQDTAAALDDAWPHISNGNAPIIRKPLKASAGAMKT